MSLELPEELLPQSVRDLVEVIGLTAALAIVEARGGIRLVVPGEASADHWLAKLIGLPPLQSLVQVYGREEFDVPRCAAALRALRERQIVAELERGASTAQVARRYVYTERGIRKLRRRVEGDLQLQSAQGQLFALEPANE